MISKKLIHTTKVPLSRGLFALIDNEDQELVLPYKWYAMGPTGKEHAVRKDKVTRKAVWMHRVILDAQLDQPLQPPLMCDHVNRNGLDNRRINLRFCLRKQNLWNQGPRPGHKYKGIWWNESHNRWAANISAHGIKYYVGEFKTDIEAALAYNEAAKFLFGEFAYLNEVQNG